MTLHIPFYTPESLGDYELISLGTFHLEEGGVIENLELAVATFGELNEEKSNAIVVPTFFSGTHQPWAEAYIGPGRALDPTKYFIVVINQIGNGVSTSPHNTTQAAIAMSRFPKVRIGDDVRAQEQLMREHFGVEQLHAVVGASMGAQQTYEWLVRFPDQVKRAAPIAGTAKNTDHDFFFAQTLADAISSDPGFAGGEYTDIAEVHDGLTRHADIWAVLGFSTEFYHSEFWKGITLPDGTTFSSAADFRDNFLRPVFRVMDPNSLLVQAWKWQRGDVSRHTDGDLDAALARVSATVSVIAFEEDMFFPPRDLEFEQQKIANSTFTVIPGVTGHFSLFGFEQSYFDALDAALSELLEREV